MNLAGYSAETMPLHRHASAKSVAALGLTALLGVAGYMYAVNIDQKEFNSKLSEAKKVSHYDSINDYKDAQEIRDSIYSYIARGRREGYNISEKQWNEMRNILESRKEKTQR